MFSSLLLIACQLVNLLAMEYFDFQINTQAIFGQYLSNWQGIISSAAALLIFYGIVWLENLPLITIVFFTTGMISNLLDRFIHSGVIDYIHLWSIPTFNLADVLICLSIGLAIYDLGRKAIKKAR